MPNAFSVSSWFYRFHPRVLASSNPGLKLANAFGVIETNAFGVIETNAFGVIETNAFGVIETEVVQGEGLRNLPVDYQHEMNVSSC